MGNCSKCGNEVAEGGFCGQCGTAVKNDAPQTEAVAPPPVPPPPMPPPPMPPPMQPPPPPNQPPPMPPPPYDPNQPPPQYAQPKALNPIFADAIATIKATVSGNPLDTSKLAAGSKVHSWLITAGIFTLLAALATILIPYGSQRANAESAFRWSWSDYTSYIGWLDTSIGAMFLFGLISAVVSFFAWTLIMRAVYAISRVDIPFVTLMNIVGASLLPIAAASAVACIVSFLFTSEYIFIFALILIGVASIARAIMLYVGIIQTTHFQRCPFWIYVGGVAVIEIIMYFIVRQIGEDFYRFNMGGIF